MKLTEHYFGSGRRIVFDNFFTSVPLCQDLVAQNLSSIGTLRKNKREIPVVLQSTQQDDPREIGSCIQLFHGELMITSYLPNKKKHVLMLSTDPDVLPLKLHGQEEKAEEAGESSEQEKVFLEITNPKCSTIGNFLHSQLLYRCTTSSRVEWTARTW